MHQVQICVTSNSTTVTSALCVPIDNVQLDSCGIPMFDEYLHKVAYSAIHWIIHWSESVSHAYYMHVMQPKSVAALSDSKVSIDGKCTNAQQRTVVAKSTVLADVAHAAKSILCAMNH